MTNAAPPAGWYTDTRTPGRERWWDGAAWTEHSREGRAVGSVATAQKHSAQTCPACGSSDVKTLRAIRAQGTSTGTGTSTGWVQGTGSQPGHMATFSTRTTSYTNAARAAAPPTKRQNGVVLVVAGVIFAALAGWIGFTLASAASVPAWAVVFAIAAAIAGFGMMIGGVILTPTDLAYNRDEFPGEFTRWSRSWQCQRCGDRFAV